MNTKDKMNILSEISGYPEDEIIESYTESFITPDDCLRAMQAFADQEVKQAISELDKFEFDATALTMPEQIKFRMLMSTGNIKVKAVEP